MNNETKLVFALEHTAHLSDLIEGNEYENHLRDALSTLDVEFKKNFDMVKLESPSWTIEVPVRKK